MNNLFTSVMAAAAVAVLTIPASADPLELNARAITNNSMGVMEKIEAGGSIENNTNFPNVNFTFSEFGVQKAGSTLLLTSDKGYSKEISLNSMFYEMQYDYDIITKIADEAITESGVYTLHVPANFFTLNGNGNEAQDFVWTYTNTSSSGSDKDKELNVLSLTINGDDLTKTGKLALLQNGDAIVVKIDPIADAMMLTLSFKDAGGTIIRSMEIYDKSGSTADPALGEYTTSVAGWAVNKFFTDQTYTVTVTAHSTNNISNPANQTWGPVDINFSGESEPYKFSDVKFTSVSPESDIEITDSSQPIIVSFSAPVESVTCEVTTGGQGSSISNINDITPNADKTVWTIKPGTHFWESSQDAWTFMIRAKDDKGLVVEGNRGTEADSYYSAVYPCYMAWPEADISPASGMVEELYEFSATEPRGIGLSFNAVPYVINAAGEKVASVDMNSQVQYDSQGNDIREGEARDVIALTSVFHLTERITEPGKYTFVIPRSSFAIGTEYDSDHNRAMTIDYQVVKLPKVAVNVELVNFANTSFEVLEGRDATVTLKPVADWKLATLTLNGEDVTGDVEADAYTIKKIAEESSLVATYEFAREVEIIETSGIVSVEGHDYNVSNNGEFIQIENLREGDVVKVYTVNGMAIAQLTASKDIVNISAPQGQIYVVMINNTAVKVRH